MSYLTRIDNTLSGWRGAPADARFLDEFTGSSIFGSSNRTRVSPDSARYMSQSNSVYSVLSRRALLLSRLPLKFYRFKDTAAPRGGRVRHRIMQHRRDEFRREFAPIAHIPTKVRNMLSSDKVEEVESSPVIDAIRHVNRFWTSTRLWQMTEQSTGIYGKCAWFIEKAKVGDSTIPTAFWWIRGDQVDPIESEELYRIGYSRHMGQGRKRDYKLDEIIYYNLPNLDAEQQGLSPLPASKAYADHESTAMESNTNLFRQGMQLGGIIMPHDEEEEWESDTVSEITYDVNRRFATVGNAHNWGVFHKRVDLHEMGHTPNEAQFLEGMKHDLEAVARAYNWPLDLISGQRTYENVGKSLVMAWTFAVLPMANFYATELTEQLLPMFDDPVDLIVFDASGIEELQQAELERWAIARGQIESGVLLQNEYREMMGWEPTAWGDAWWVSGKKVPVTDLESTEEEPPKEEPEDIEEESEEDDERETPFGMRLVRNLSDIPSALALAQDARDKADEDIRLFNRLVPEWNGILEAELLRAKQVYYFDDKRKHFIDAKGNLIPWNKINDEALASFQEALRGRAQKLANRLEARTISFSEFRESIRTLIRQQTTVSFIAGVGGLEKMTAASWGAIGGRLAGQYGHLNKYLSKLAQSGEYNARVIGFRTGNYVKGGGWGYHRAQGMLHNLKLPAYPRDGSTPCLSNCGCSWVFTYTDNFVIARWQRGLVDSCPVCVERESTWARLEFDRSETDVPTI